MSRRPASEETRALMRAAHLRRWEANRDRYVEANARAADVRRGMKYTIGTDRLPRNSRIVDQNGVVYRSVDEVCEKLGLTERLVRLVLEGKRASTGGYSFKLVSRSYESYIRRRAFDNSQE
jgi:hypothetical protein